MSFDDIEGLWNAGTWEIVVPIPDILHGNIDRIEFIPNEAPDIHDRHPHHKAGHTCWSQFGDPVIGTMKDVEIAELFRTLRIFVGRWYKNSELTHDFRKFITRAVRYDTYERKFTEVL